MLRKQPHAKKKKKNGAFIKNVYILFFFGVSMFAIFFSKETTSHPHKT